MLIEKHSFDGGMNGDIDTKLLPSNTMLNCMNGRMAVNEQGRDLRIENLPGTLLVPQTVRPPYGVDQTIGTAIDFDNGRLLFLNYNTVGDHGIYCYDPYANSNTGFIYAVLYDSQVIGGLGFSKNSLIHSTRVENGTLYWVDSTNNEPRRININRGIAMNHAGVFPTVTPYQYPMSQSVLYWIRRQPGLPLTVEKDTDATFDNNFIELEAFEFAYRYIYREYELSTLSGLSELINYDTAAQTFNFITITVPLAEAIAQDVLQVDLVAKYLNSNKSVVVKSWNKGVPVDLVEINAHNAGTTALSFDFYNDIVGIALDDAYVAKPYDSVPIYAQTMEIARNRSFMANYIAGYDTPITTSLVAAGQESSSATLTGQWVKIDYNSGATSHYFLDVNSLFYDVTPQPVPPPYPSSVAFATMTLVATGVTNFAIYISTSGLYPNWINGIQYPGFTATITGGPPVPGIAGTTAFKSGASYQLSISFLDHAGRKCGILTSNTLKVNIPDRIYSQIDYTTSIVWSLSNANAVNEIPNWAYYYSINITKCLTTRFFLQTRAKNLTYVTKDADGNYVFNSQNYSTTRNGIGVDITLLNNAGMGYTFAEGDLVNIYIGSNLYRRRIVAQDGNWIVCELDDLGVIGNTASPYGFALFQIYTPYKASVSEPYFEVAQIFKVTNPTASNRTYSQLGGSIGGDITLLTRNDGTSDFLTENMSPNDTLYTRWNTDAGRPNFIDRIGQQTRTNDITYSDTFVPQTKINGLSTYEALNVKNIPFETGDITKLQTANKISNEQGTIMLAICQHDIASCYLGEVQLIGASQNAFVAQAAEIIGTINILQGSFGTTRAESVTQYLGLVFGTDLLNGVEWQYSPNGLEPVSRYGQARFFKNYSKDYLLASANNLDNINGFHHIRGTVDPFTKELLVTLPALIYENYADVLPSYSSVPSYATSIVDRFDIYDQLGKAMSFMFLENKWGSNYEGLSEWSDYIENQLYFFKNGNLYKAASDTTNWNNWFGTNYPVRICSAANANPSLLKDLADIAVESNATPDFSVAMAIYPNTQITDLSASDYTDQQSNRYASWFRDRLSPNVSGTADQKLYTGDQLTDKAILWMAEFQAYSSLTFINFVNIGWEISRGQQAIANPINK